MSGRPRRKDDCIRDQPMLESVRVMTTSTQQNSTASRSFEREPEDEPQAPASNASPRASKGKRRRAGDSPENGSCSGAFVRCDRRQG